MLDNAFPECFCNRAGIRVDMKLVVNAAEVGRNCVHADTQGVCYFLLEESFGEKSQNFLLSCGQSVVPFFAW